MKRAFVVFAIVASCIFGGHALSKDQGNGESYKITIMGRLDVPKTTEIETIVANTYNLESWDREPLSNVVVSPDNFEEVMSFFADSKTVTTFDTSLYQVGTLHIVLKSKEVVTINWYDYGKGIMVFSIKGVALYSTDRHDKGAPALILDSRLRAVDKKARDARPGGRVER